MSTITAVNVKPSATNSGRLEEKLNHDKYNSADSNETTINIVEGDKREEMNDYWKNHSKRLNIQEMMLDENADQISEEESNEILSMLPEMKGKRLVELGAGIGRLTGRLADVAHHVIAVDFMEPFITKNKEIHSQYDNIEFQVADVTKLDLPPKSVDIVFSNWLFMYISDEETLKVFKRVLNWLTDDGYFFIRESCFHQSGNMMRNSNPTLYRDPTVYAQIIESTATPSNDGKSTTYLDTVFARPVQTYIKYKQNSNQICWLLKMTSTNDVSSKNSDHSAHNKKFHTVQAEMVDSLMFDEDIRTNGMKMEEKKFYDELKLTGDQFVIDGGCGNGKYTFLLAREYNVQVLGMDVSSHQVTLAMKRNNRIKDSRVFFEICNLENLPYSSQMVDVIHCRDTLHHTTDRKKVLAGIYKILKADGRVMIGEFTLKDKTNIAQNKENHLDHFDTVDEYVNDLKDAGFINVRFIDATQFATDEVKKEYEKRLSSKEKLLQTYASDIVNQEIQMMEWFSKLFADRDSTGLTYTFFYGEK